MHRSLWYKTLMSHVSNGTTLSELLVRVIEPEKQELSQELAEFLARLQFPPQDQQRLKELAEKQRQGTLSEVEEAEMDGYIQVADLVEVLKAKALTSLK